MSEEKKPMSTQRITLIITAIMVALSGVSGIANWAFDFTGKYQDWKDAQDQRTIDKYAEATSDSTISKVIRTIDPLTTATFSAYRDSVNRQIRNGKHIAFSYMNAIDSLSHIINEKDRKVERQSKRIDMLETELQVAKAKTRDEGLQTVMNTLEKVLNQRSQSQKLDSMMVEIRKMNREKLKNITSGDRAQ